MEKVIAGIVAILMMACASPQKAEPKILPTVGDQAIENYLIRINFVLFQDEIANSPNNENDFVLLIKCVC